MRLSEKLDVIRAEKIKLFREEMEILDILNKYYEIESKLGVESCEEAIQNEEDLTTADKLLLTFEAYKDEHDKMLKKLQVRLDDIVDEDLVQDFLDTPIISY